MFGRISAHGERRALCLAMQLGSNGLLRSPPFSQKQPFGKGTNQRLTEEDAAIVIQQREHYQHPQAAEAPDKGQDQARNGREGREDEVEGSHAFTRVWHHPDQSFLPAPSSSLAWLLVLVFQSFSWLPWLPESCSFKAEKETEASQLSSPSFPYSRSPQTPQLSSPVCPSAGQGDTDTLHHRSAQKTHP